MTNKRQQPSYHLCKNVYLGSWANEAFNYFTLYQDIMHGLWTRIISSVVELGVDIADSPAMSFQGRDVQPNSYRTRLTWHLKSTPKRNIGNSKFGKHQFFKFMLVLRFLFTLLREMIKFDGHFKRIAFDLGGIVFDLDAWGVEGLSKIALQILFVLFSFPF